MTVQTVNIDKETPHHSGPRQGRQQYILSLTGDPLPAVIVPVAVNPSV